MNGYFDKESSEETSKNPSEEIYDSKRKRKI